MTEIYYLYMINKTNYETSTNCIICLPYFSYMILYTDTCGNVANIHM